MNTLTTAIAGVLAGLIVGGAAGAGTYAFASDPKDSKEYKVSTAQLSQRDAALAEAEQTIDQLNGDVASLQAAMTELEGNLPTREARVEAAEADIKRKYKLIQKARRSLATALRDVQRRERAVGIAEKQAARNTIPGEGAYRVGQDMKPGTYRSVDNGSGCYYTISTGANGSNLIDNGFTKGPAIATVSTGQLFETSDCGDWVLQ